MKLEDVDPGTLLAVWYIALAIIAILVMTIGQSGAIS